MTSQNPRETHRSFHPLGLAVAGALVLAPQPNVVYGAGLGFEAAPACTQDVYRNFSVKEASDAVSAVGDILAAEGPGLVNPALNEAKGLMNTAWSHLEQVMNQGALKWSNYCMICDPLKGGATVASYMDVAEDLVAVSEQVYDRDGYGEYLGLVETMAQNRELLDYCGHYAGTLRGTDYLDEIDGCYEFGRTGGAIDQIDLTLTQTLSFSKVGLNILNRPRPSEGTYWPLGSELVFVHLYDKSVTAILKRQDDDSYAGAFIPRSDDPVERTHYLKRRTWALTGFNLHRNGVTADTFGGPDIIEHWLVTKNQIRRQIEDTVGKLYPILSYEIDDLTLRLTAGEPATLTIARPKVSQFDPNSGALGAWQLAVRWSSTPPLLTLGHWTLADEFRPGGVDIVNITLDRADQLTPIAPYELAAGIACRTPKNTTFTVTLNAGHTTYPGRVDFTYEEVP